MIIKGNFTQATVFTDNIEETAKDQILTICNQEIFKDTNIKIMPDCHAGAGAVIGFTMPLTHFIIPNLVGVDIGCGIDGFCLDYTDEINFQDFDDYFRKLIPSGFNINSKHNFQPNACKDYVEVSKRLKLDENRVLLSIGSLGGGNHFCELGRDSDNRLWIFIHSGSRNFGLQIAKYHQKKALEFVQKEGIVIARGLEYLMLNSVEGQEYLNDMYIAQEYAFKNRNEMLFALSNYFKCPIHKIINTAHNYINKDDSIIRKGAIQANAGQDVLIPFNMRDGVIIGKGKGNAEWNNSAPHGAGRILSRTKAKQTLDINTFKDSMKGIWSSCITESTLDESPAVYKPKEEILKHVIETIDIIDFVKPIYNFKAE